MKYKGFLILVTLIYGNNFVYSQLSWDPKPLAEFRMYGDEVKPCEYIVILKDMSKINDSCNFNGDSCDKIVDWTYDFGDGHKSKLKDPTNSYKHAYFIDDPIFKITLKIKTKYGFTDSFSQLIFVSQPRPKFRLLSDTVIEVGDTAFFENTSLAPFYNPSWLWNFGDGKVLGDTVKKICNYNYGTPGKYDIYLSLFDNINGSSIRCSFTYPDTTAGFKKKISITVLKQSSFKNYLLNKLSIFPNPAYDHIFIKGLTKGDIVIFDITGKEILRTDINHTQSVDISKLVKGAYFIRCVDGSSRYNGRFVKVL